MKYEILNEAKYVCQWIKYTFMKLIILQWAMRCVGYMTRMQLACS